MTIDPVVVSGVILLMQYCLRPTREDLVTFSDKTTSEFVSITVEAAEKLTMRLASLFFPVVWLQRAIPNEIGLGLPARRTSKEDGTILTCLSFSSDYPGFQGR